MNNKHLIKHLKKIIGLSLKSEFSEKIINHHIYSSLIKFSGFFIFLLFLLFISCSDISNTNQEDRYVIILSMDGFRHDYADRFNTPNLDYIAQNGVVSHSLIPVFPSFTFPNHYSIATGLYPDNHGIVANNFYCPELEASFYISDRNAIENGDFYGGEPIWVSAENQGVTTATFFWVGSEAKIKGMQPTYWKKYDYSISFETRIKYAISWLSLSLEKRPRLIMLYFNEPDYHGHKVGPENDNIGNTIEYLDALVGVLHKKLQRLFIYKNINFIITSDHGMCQISSERYIDISKHIDINWIERRHGSNPVYFIKPKPEYADTIYTLLSAIENISIWKNENIPSPLNFGTHPRTLDMTIVADSSWSIGFGEQNKSYLGAHGYDNKNKDMHTVFYAIGPDFKKGYTHSEFEVIDIYPLLAYLLDIEIPEVDGKIERVKDMLNKR